MTPVARSIDDSCEWAENPCSILAGPVKRFLLRLLAAFGLAPARTVAAQVRTIEELKAALLAWKMKAGEASARAKQLEAELREQKKIVQRTMRAAGNSQVPNAALDKMAEQLAAADRELAIARDYLMAIEVKLDILEGAANVLDLRTRPHQLQPPAETSASV